MLPLVQLEWAHQNYLKTTAGFFERTRDHEGRAVLFQVRLELFAHHLGRVALVGARNRQTTALAVVHLVVKKKKIHQSECIHFIIY